MGLRIIGFGLLFAALAIVAVVLYRNNPKSEIPLVFTPTQVLQATWNNYKSNYILSGSNRTVDPSRGDITTSEGESYTMLRAVWLGDKQTFDASWQFTRNSLQRPDGLFSWLYGKEQSGGFGILNAQGGSSAASDADSDIALSLIFAYARWQDPQYLSAAKQIVASIWNEEVVYVNGTPYLAADDKEKTSNSGSVLINPSYFSPYSYRLFAKIDPAHPWNALVNSSYNLLAKSIAAPISGTAGGLPPDWLSLNTTTGAVSATNQTSLNSDYGYDALRVPWRVGLDWEWNHDERAQKVLSAMSVLGQSWKADGMLDTVYSHAGQPIGDYESPAMYGGAVGYFLLADPSDAQKVYTSKLVYLYNPDTNAWKEQLSYYDDNWAWFGIALYNHLLPNLAANLPASAFANL